MEGRSRFVEIRLAAAQKQKCGITDRTDIITIRDLIDFDEKLSD